MDECGDGMLSLDLKSQRMISFIMLPFMLSSSHFGSGREFKGAGGRG